MISVVVLTKNDEKLIGICLESVKWADEVIVYDNGSVDKTLEIAKRYTDKIYQYEGEDFAKIRNLAMEKSKGEWVFYVDSDERVLKPLQEEIIGLVKSSEKGAYAVSRKNIIFGELVDYGPYKSDWMIRLLKKDRFKGWVGKIHEHATFDGGLGYLKNQLLHLTHRNLDQIVLKSLSWSHYDAKLRVDAKHPPLTGWRFIRIFITESFNQLVKRGGLSGGTVGVIDSMLQVFSLFMSYVRLWEMQQPKTRDQVYEEADKKLIENKFNSLP